MEATSSGFILIVALILAGPRTSAEIAKISEVELVQSPASASVAAGQFIIMACGFSRPVNCSWKRNSVVVDISNRYKYIDYANGVQTMNCWIEIKTVEEQDAGQWSCGFYANDADIVILSNSANLSVTGKNTGTNAQSLPDHKVTFTQCPSAATVKSGQSVTLACAFDHPVNCSWWINSTPVVISNRYRYVDGHDGRDTKNCTVKITGADHSLDNGKWTCTAKTDHSNISPGSRSASLNVHLDNNEPPGTRSSAETVKISEVKFVHSPASAIVAAGQSVILACGFSCPVNCSWKRNSVVVEIVNRYEYIDDANGIQTRNCWIEIKTVEEQDAGQWRCGFYANDDDIVILSNPANLSVTGNNTDTNAQNQPDRNLTFTQCPSNATVKSGQSVILACALDHPVNCSWWINSTPVVISNRYRYVEGHDGRDTKNCTVEITGADHSLDTGKWTCTVKTDHSKVPPGSRSARLNVQLDNNEPPGPRSRAEIAKTSELKLVHSPASANVTAGQSLILACEFDRPVNCFWKRNTSIVTIAERYKYIDGGNGTQTRNCSIKIEMTNVKDAGSWTCVIPMTPAGDGMQSEPAYIQVAGTDSEICSTEPSPLATQTADVNAAMIAVIVTQAIIIAAFLTYILWLRRAKAPKQHTYENIGPSVLYASTSQPVQNVTEVITGTRWSSTTETSRGYLMPRQVQISQNTVYAKNSPRYHVYETIPE